MSADDDIPAWSHPFTTESRSALARLPAFESITREWAMAGDGSGVTVAIIDSGVERDHPAVGGKLVRSVVVEPSDDPEGDPVIRDDPESLDVVGHGTACAGIIHSIAPAADLVSVRVLGPDNRGKGYIFAAGLDWATREGAQVMNLSLSSKSEALFPIFHELADAAYFANSVLVCAANNVPGNSFPSLFAAVVSVASHDLPQGDAWFYNPKPPVEFAGRGIDVPIAWIGGKSAVATGNSFATPHIAGWVARIRSAHPNATPFEVKAILAATADRVGPARPSRRKVRSPAEG